ncbi:MULTISPECIES: Lrp/AsnC family transcriptional regulator [unclassified Nocardioides]|uniref:Lrp/AsnC family transcriptional regulator n=1 Tax=unclassified Nocardioides TaxID=2615069 RepID=UPI0006F22056|nr:MULTISPECIES: Lrp/AsnC family transcriptional regulator [unclassified Nocardioides]KQY64010.1 AsnC family transcriptional regulator [Nocardioides sp. Root140]KQZ69930.1 AsnC family transcriptional regulator [Nocardioides sp. Root151]KRF16023.1 AsnC family transcriptional regulator [Nocardioides sp. Soil796]
MQEPVLEESDLVLIHALQIAPRATWTEVAGVLGTTATTLAQRWDRLRSRGLAWVTAHPSARGETVGLGFVEVDCEPGATDEVLAWLCRDPRAVTIDQSARGRDFVVTVMTPDLPSLTHFLLDELAHRPGVQRQRTRLATGVHRQGNDWRLDALAPGQRTALEKIGRATRPTTVTPLPAGSGPLVEELAKDGRATAAELARVTGRNPATVRRQLAKVIASGALSFRCEVARETSYWPIHCDWLARVPTTEWDRTLAALATLPELRLCVTTTGETNMLITVWTRSLTDLLRVERLVSEKLPWLNVVESVVNLRTLKRMGWLVGENGRATGEVVVPSALSSE